METLNRTDLTEYETERLHQTALKVKEYSREVGAFMVHYGAEGELRKGAYLYLSLLEDLTDDTDIRTEALEYGLVMAGFRAKDSHRSQAEQLRNEFLVMLYQNAIADRD